MSINIDVSLGEFWDKITILQIKTERIRDKDKLRNIERDLRQLNDSWQQTAFDKSIIYDDLRELRHINETLWEIENEIRDKELTQEFDDDFIKLARSVYVENDKRAEVKSRINTKLGSLLREEKSYKKDCAG